MRLCDLCPPGHMRLARHFLITPGTRLAPLCVCERCRANLPRGHGYTEPDPPPGHPRPENRGLGSEQPALLPDPEPE